MIQEQTLTPEEEQLIDQEMRRRGNSKLISYLLWFFLGFLGVHRFYNDAIKTGIIQASLLITGFLLLIYLGSLDMPINNAALEAYTQCSELHPNDLQTCMPHIEQFSQDWKKGGGHYYTFLSTLIMIILCVIPLWWFIDAFLIPSLVERKNQTIRQKYGQKVLSQRNTSRL